MVIGLATMLRATAAEVPHEPVSFVRDIAPVLISKCLTCHNLEKAKGGFQLQTFELMMKGGESKV